MRTTQTTTATTPITGLELRDCACGCAGLISSRSLSRFIPGHEPKAK
jgi:hypothetical protein